MSDDFARKHIASLVAEARRGPLKAARRLEAACWPGGSADRVEPAASEWLARWHPARAAAATPVCGCSTGHCPICN